MDDDDGDRAHGASGERPASSGARTVQHCPWCGEHIGSFWGRREADGSHWCESCQAFFRVEEL
ncbi:MAG: hypothetical protein KDC46_04875 [Thermoleophilia bacterium]|nr:hypothetical protein [Thermoleophilia bacterium]